MALPLSRDALEVRRTALGVVFSIEAVVDPSAVQRLHSEHLRAAATWWLHHLT